MREEYRDTLLFFLVAMFNQFYQAFVIIYPYIGSYLVMKAPHLKLNDMYTCVIFMVFGTIIGNTILPQIVDKVQIRVIFLVTALCYCVSTLMFLACNDRFKLWTNAVVAGMINQVFHLGTLTYLRLKYHQECTKYFGIFSCGYPVGIAVIIGVTQTLVNPDNRQMEFTEWGDTTFDPEVSLNAVRLIWLMAGSMALMGGIVYALISDITPEDIIKESEYQQSLLNETAPVLPRDTLLSVNVQSHVTIQTFFFADQSSANPHPDQHRSWFYLATEFRFLFIFCLNIMRFLSVD